MNILITGADGMLGLSLVPLLKKSHTTICCTHKKSYDQYLHLDITNKQLVSEIIGKNNIDCVVHLAALTDVDYCETHKEEALLINYEATKNLTSLCKKYHVYFIFISTGAVFSGKKKTAYIENDIRKPVNIYGLSKKKAEDCVKTLPSYCIVRTGWLMRGGDKDHKFMSFILRQIKQHKKIIYAVSDVFGSPTFTDDLAQAIFKIISKKAYGIYHVVNQGIASRYEIVMEMLHILKKQTQLIPVSFGYFHEKAKRPRMEALNGKKLEQDYHLVLSDWKKPLSGCLHKRYEKK